MFFSICQRCKTLWILLFKLTCWLLTGDIYKKPEHFYILNSIYTYESSYMNQICSLTGGLILTEKIQLFKSIFRGREDVYGSGTCIRQQLSVSVISDHLLGVNRIGVYLLINKNQTLFIVVDIDKDIPLLAKDYHDRARHYLLPTYIEKSKSKGYHCWHFFTNPIEAKKARILIKEILSEIELNTEIFPKQDETDDVGNFIYLPLFNEGKDGKTVFVDPDNGFVPYPDQWEFLRNIKKIIPEQIEGIIELNDFYNKEEIKETERCSDRFETCHYKWIFQTLNGIHEGEGRNDACFKLSRYYLSKLPTCKFRLSSPIFPG
jgi:hypothetical protein